MNVVEIKNVEAEAGVIASVLLKPELTFYSEQLKPNYFTDENNAWIYYAVCELAKRGVEKVDAYNITNLLNLKEGTKKATETVTIQSLNELFDVARIIARDSVEDYNVLVTAVIRCAFRRYSYDKLAECQRLCFSSSEQDIEQKIYRVLDDVMMEFSMTNEVPQYKDVVDALWSEVEARQGAGAMSGIPFKFPALNSYVTLERGELVVFGAEAKQGKSMLLLNCAVDVLKQDKSVLYLDSELNSRLFTCRLMSHLTGIEFARIRSGRYSDEEMARIDQAREWIKTRKFTHLYMPIYDWQSVYSTFKKVYHTQGVDVLIIDYFKDTSEGDAFSSYKGMGNYIDRVKNELAGNYNICALGAAQATSTGKLADSARIARNASTIVMINDKTPEEIEADGVECGNKKLFIKYNRNGPQMVEGEYIDLQFDGDIISYTEAKQHVPIYPY